MYIVKDNRYNFLDEQLFVVGKRDNNPKRSFLFVSKLLGKHIAVKPETVKAAGFLLSSLKYGFDNSSFVDCIKENSTPDYTNHAIDCDVLIIGFCETATALGMAVASSIEGSTYIATTREPVYGIGRLVTFEEEHSHASTHFMYSDDIELSDFRKIILVDDEITTGNSLLHLMNTFVGKSNVEEISIMTILDWRSDEQRLRFKEFSCEHNVRVNVYSLLTGSIEDYDKNVYVNESVDEAEFPVASTALSIFPKVEMCVPEYGPLCYLEDTGRFGITYDRILSIEEKARTAASAISRNLNPSSVLLVLGHGENIYIPSRIAACLESMGHDVTFKTTSRTPIYCDGTIFKDIQAFDENGTKYHFYNRCEAEKNDAVIMLSENGFKHRLCNNIMVFDL